MFWIILSICSAHSICNIIDIFLPGPSRSLTWQRLHLFGFFFVGDECGNTFPFFDNAILWPILSRSMGASGYSTSRSHPPSVPHASLVLPPGLVQQRLSRSQ